MLNNCFARACVPRSRSNRSSASQGDGTGNAPSGFVEGDGGGAVVDLCSDSFGSLSGSPEVRQVGRWSRCFRLRQRRQIRSMSLRLEASGAATRRSLGRRICAFPNRTKMKFVAFPARNTVSKRGPHRRPPTTEVPTLPYAYDI